MTQLCGAHPSIKADTLKNKSLLLLFFRKEGFP